MSPIACWQETDEALELIHSSKVGDIVTIRDKRYRIRKKTITACSIERYYWWDALYDRWFKEKN